MVTTKECFQTRSAQVRTQIRSGLVCNKPEQPTGAVHFTLPRPKSKGRRRSKLRLGAVEPLLPVSPQTFDFEGFTEAETVQYRNSIISNSGKSTSSLFETTKITTLSSINIQSESTADSGLQVDKGDKNFSSSRLEILKEANSSALPECDDLTINLMSESVKSSSEQEYQRKWKAFTDFVQSKGIHFDKINVSIVIRFLSYLFHVKKLKPSTIALYRSALSRPLSEYFNQDLNCPRISCLLRGMRIRRPHEPSPKPQWSLNKVLTLLENIVSLTETNSLRKTAFLLLLATGWRISEVHACVREEEYSSFNERGSL